MYDYDAFGNQRDVPGYDADGDTNPFRYCGEYLDAETDTYYLRARNYNPSTGRFLTEDPAQARLNWYTYCNNNPIAFVDPLGLDAVLINKAIENPAGTYLGVEHMAAFFQDENDSWWYFSWEDTVKYVQVEDTSIFESLDSINEWLLNYRDPDDSEFRLLYSDKHYRDSVYVQGDFTASNNGAAAYFGEYKAAETTWDGNGYANKQYNLVTNNCGQVAMRLLSMGTLPDGTNVGSYIAGRGYYTTGELPDIHMNNMQNIFYNKAHNFTGFESAMQTQRAKYEGKNDFIQWWYSDLKNNINTISP